VTTGAALSLVNWAEEAEAAAGIARALAGTAFVPDSLRVYDDQHNLDLDATVATVTAALLTGTELGMGPMAALQSIDVIPPGSGQPSLRALALRGLLQHHGHDIWVVESTNSRAVVRGRRADSEIVMESVWTIDRARQMGPRGFNDPRGAWQRIPQNQLVARATAEMARWVDSDGLLGLPYTSEEIGDLDDADHSPDAARWTPALDRPDQPPAEGAAPARSGAKPRRASRRKARGTPAPAGALPPAPEPPASGADRSAASPETPPVPGPGISATQRAALWAGMKRIGITERAAALAAVSGWIGRVIGSSNELTAAEAGVALASINQREALQATRAAQDAAAESTEEVPLGDAPDE
jgi:hypothetical protein